MAGDWGRNGTNGFPGLKGERGTPGEPGAPGIPGRDGGEVRSFINHHFSFSRFRWSVCLSNDLLYRDLRVSLASR